MKNTLEERDDYFAPVDYTPLLKILSSIVKSQANAFQVKKQGDKTCLQLDLDAIALAMVQKSKQDNMPFIHLYGTTHASVNFADDTVIKAFNRHIDTIKDMLQAHLEEAFQKILPASPLQENAQQLLSHAKDFHAKNAYHLHYPISKCVHWINNDSLDTTSRSTSQNSIDKGTM